MVRYEGGQFARGLAKHRPYAAGEHFLVLGIVEMPSWGSAIPILSITSIPSTIGGIAGRSLNQQDNSEQNDGGKRGVVVHSGALAEGNRR